MDNRYGTDIGKAALYLSQHPNEPEAHRLYQEAIKKMMGKK